MTMVLPNLDGGGSGDVGRSASGSNWQQQQNNNNGAPMVTMMPSIVSAANLLVRQSSAGRMGSGTNNSNLGASMMGGAGGSASGAASAAARMRTNKLRAKVSTGNLLKLRAGNETSNSNNSNIVASTPSPYVDTPLVGGSKFGNAAAMAMTMLGQSTMLTTSIALASSTPKEGVLDMPPPSWSAAAANNNTSNMTLASPTLAHNNNNNNNNTSNSNNNNNNGNPATTLGRISSNLSSFSAHLGSNHGAHQAGGAGNTMPPVRISSSGHLQGGGGGHAAAGAGPLNDDDTFTGDNASISVSFQASHGGLHGGGGAAAAAPRQAFVQHTASGQRILQNLSYEERLRMQAVFDRYDTKGTGSIENSTLVKLLSEIGHPMPASQALELLRQVDSNQNGLMEFEELLQLVIIFKSVAQFRMDTTTPSGSSDHHWSGSGASGKQFDGGAGGGTSDERDDFADIPGGAKATSTQYHISKAMNKFKAILPDSALWKWTWEITILVTYMYIFASVTSMHMRDDTVDIWNQADYFYWSDIGITAILLGEMIMSCFVSFQGRNGAWVEDFSVITMNYLGTWFIPDMISLLPLRCFVPDRAHELTTLMIVLAHFRLARFPRLYFTSFLNSNQVGMTREYIGFYFVFAPLAKQLAALLCAIHLYAVIWMRILDDTQNYATGIYITMYYFSAVGYGGFETTTASSEWWSNICCLSALFINAAVVGNVVSIMNQADVEGSRQNRLVETQAVLQFFDVPTALQEEILQFQNYVLQKDIQTAHRGLMDSLPAEIRANLQLQLQLHVLYGVPLFRTAHQTVKIALVQQFASVICCPEEYLVVSGEDAMDIIFISYGFIDLVDCNGVYVTTLRNGHSFGEALMFAPREAPVIHEMSAKSLGYSELLVLGIEGLWAVSDMFPAFARDIAEYGRDMQLGVDAPVVAPDCVPVTASAAFEPTAGGRGDARRGSKIELRGGEDDDDDIEMMHQHHRDDEGVGFFVGPNAHSGSGDEKDMTTDFGAAHGIVQPTGGGRTTPSNNNINSASEFRRISSGAQGNRRRQSSVAFAPSGSSGGGSPEERKRRRSSAGTMSPEHDKEELLTKRTSSLAESIKNFFTLDGSVKGNFDNAASPKSHARTGVLRPFRVNAEGEVAFLLGIAGSIRATSDASTMAMAQSVMMNGSTSGNSLKTSSLTTTARVTPGFPVEGSIGLSTSTDTGAATTAAQQQQLRIQQALIKENITATATASSDAAATAFTTSSTSPPSSNVSPGQHHGNNNNLTVVIGGLHCSLADNSMIQSGGSAAKISPPSSSSNNAPHPVLPTPRTSNGGGSVTTGGGGGGGAPLLRRLTVLTSEEEMPPHSHSHTVTPLVVSGASTGFFFGTGGGPAVAGTSNAPHGKLQTRRGTVVESSGVGVAQTPRTGLAGVIGPNNATATSAIAQAPTKHQHHHGQQQGALSAHRQQKAAAVGVFPTIYTSTHGDDNDHSSPVGTGEVPFIKISGQRSQSQQPQDQQPPQVVVTATSNSSDEVFREADRQRRQRKKNQSGDDVGSTTGDDDDVVKSPLLLGAEGQQGGHEATEGDDESDDWKEVRADAAVTESRDKAMRRRRAKKSEKGTSHHAFDDDDESHETSSISTAGGIAKKPIIAWHAHGGGSAGDATSPRAADATTTTNTHASRLHSLPHGVAAGRVATIVANGGRSPNSQEGTAQQPPLMIPPVGGNGGGVMHQLFLGGGAAAGTPHHYHHTLAQQHHVGGGGVVPFLDDPCNIHMTNEEWQLLVSEVTALLKLVDQASDRLTSLTSPHSPPNSSSTITSATGGGGGGDGLVQENSHSLYSPAATNTPHHSPHTGPYKPPTRTTILPIVTSMSGGDGDLVLAFHSPPTPTRGEHDESVSYKKSKREDSDNLSATAKPLEAPVPQQAIQPRDEDIVRAMSSGSDDDS
ncbi:Ca2+-binding protein, putative [Bodo saltans]|uniref:Ca2+-binding protein, putative n=1 Tax=Bodo saltans TaxID=75058 RepID=A0A0S4JBQ8_BODSA|nr:Ca2+-binding protein, putative [Bodo saltans]|eukprot:CUG87651.1 Ca2+-binding protein, putative [Bodo saltans]